MLSREDYIDDLARKRGYLDYFTLLVSYNGKSVDISTAYNASYDEYVKTELELEKIRELIKE